MSYRQINLAGTSEEFRKGFLAAVDFLDGADRMQVYSSNAESVILTLEDDDDNCTYTIEDGVVRFDSSGVEI